MNSILNPELLKLAADQTQTKSSFVDAATAQGAMPPGGDPAAGGMPPGGDPAAMAGPMPPMPAMGGEDPAAAAGGGMGPDEVRALVQEMLLQQGGAAGAGAGGEKKMKVDVNQEIYQIKKMLAMMAEEMGMPIPPTMLLGDPALDPHVPEQEAAKDPMSAAAQQSAIQPIQPMGAAAPGMDGGGEAQKVADERIHRGTAVDVPTNETLARNVDTSRALLAQLNA